MIKLNCLCKDWKTHRCSRKIIIYHKSSVSDNNYEVWFHDRDGKETLINTGEESLLKFAREIIKLIVGKEFKVSISKGI
ncbi:MAG: hypothetical protein E3J87_09135 [Candidatus Cloacimonadota bacterium]|nr:MAG: hypothetical protein E3J87_09135 [Candidatus Cloacimonadota bacterium]